MNFRSNTPLVSVILPVYNADATVRSAVESLRSQTYENIEVIIIDDGSTDSSVRIVEGLVSSDSRFTLYRNSSNQGLCKTLNWGLRLAKGEYVARADADDINLRSRVEKQVEHLSKFRDIDVVGSAVYLEDENGDIYGPVSCFVEGLNNPDCLNTKLYHPTVMARKSFFEKVGNYDERFERAEDTEIWVRGGKQMSRYYNLPEPLLIYRSDGYKRSISSLIKRTRSLLLLGSVYDIAGAKSFAVRLFICSIATKYGLYKPRVFRESLKVGDQEKRMLLIENRVES